MVHDLDGATLRVVLRNLGESTECVEMVQLDALVIFDGQAAPQPVHPRECLSVSVKLDRETTEWLLGGFWVEVSLGSGVRFASDVHYLLSDPRR